MQDNWFENTKKINSWNLHPKLWFSAWRIQPSLIYLRKNTINNQKNSIEYLPIKIWKIVYILECWQKLFINAEKFLKCRRILNQPSNRLRDLLGILLSRQWASIDQAKHLKFRSITNFRHPKSTNSKLLKSLIDFNVVFYCFRIISWTLLPVRSMQTSRIMNLLI